MFSEYRQPRWRWLYPVLPLAIVLFWLVDRTHTSGTERRLLEIGVMLFVWAYVEVWQRLNLVALLRHPFTGIKGRPLFTEREAVPPGATPRTQPMGSYYSDLFVAPVAVWQSAPPSIAGEARSSKAIGAPDAAPAPEWTVQAEGSDMDA